MKYFFGIHEKLLIWQNLEGMSSSWLQDRGPVEEEKLHLSCSKLQTGHGEKWYRKPTWKFQVETYEPNLENLLGKHWQGFRRVWYDPPSLQSCWIRRNTVSTMPTMSSISRMSNISYHYRIRRNTESRMSTMSSISRMSNVSRVSSMPRMSRVSRWSRKPGNR